MGMKKRQGVPGHQGRGSRGAGSGAHCITAFFFLSFSFHPLSLKERHIFPFLLLFFKICYLLESYSYTEVWGEILYLLVHPPVSCNNQGQQPDALPDLPSLGPECLLHPRLLSHVGQQGAGSKVE